MPEPARLRSLPFPGDRPAHRLNLRELSQTSPRRNPRPCAEQLQFCETPLRQAHADLLKFYAIMETEFLRCFQCLGQRNEFLFVTPMFVFISYMLECNRSFVLLPSPMRGLLAHIGANLSSAFYCSRNHVCLCQ